VEEVGEAIIAGEEVGEVASPAKDVEVAMPEGRERRPRKRIFWIWGSTWISRLPSNLLVAVKVSPESVWKAMRLVESRVREFS
jgi:hypothetical protein